MNKPLSIRPKRKLLFPSTYFNKFSKKYIDNLNAATKLANLFENAVYIDSKNNEKKSYSNLKFHHFIAPLFMNGENYRVRIVARESSVPGVLYIVETELMQNKKMNSVHAANNAPRIWNSSFEISVADLVKDVKIYSYENSSYDIYDINNIRFSTKPTNLDNQIDFFGIMQEAKNSEEVKDVIKDVADVPVEEAQLSMDLSPANFVPLSELWKSEPPAETVTTTVQKKETPKTQKKSNTIEDFGNKIGGARKDLWRERGLSLNDIFEMNEGEKGKYITKDNVWKKTDYKALYEAGADKAVVYFIKQLRDALPTSPSVGYYSERIYGNKEAYNEKVQERREEYINLVSTVKDEAVKMKTFEDAQGFFDRFFIESGMFDRDTRKVSNSQVTSKFFSAAQNAKSKATWDYYVVRAMNKAGFLEDSAKKLPKNVSIMRLRVV